MQTHHIFIQLALCMSLVTPVAMAQELSVPDKEHRQGMSYEEYSSFREKMRMRMEKRQESQHEEKEADRPARQSERNAEGTYGQGYQTRKHIEERPNTGTDNRPERPHFERFNRGDRPQR